MKMITPIDVVEATLIATSVAENDAPAWDVATTYAVNDEVISTATHSHYICVTAGSGVDPDTDDGSNWVRLGATNRWKAFDKLISDPVTDTGPISYTIQPTSMISGIALFGVDADHVSVTVTLGSRSEVFQKTLVNLDDVEGWHSWLFSGVVREKEALFLDLPYYGSGTEYKIDVTGAGVLQIGQIVLGQAVSIGNTAWGAEIGILDYSRKDRDAYGNAIIVERRFSRLASFPIGVDSRRARRVQRKLEDYRAAPAVWIGDERLEYALMIYGFYKSYSHVLDQDDWSRAVIEVEGLV